MRYATGWLLGVPMTVVMTSLGLVVGLLGRDAARPHRLARIWANWMLRILDVRLRVAGADRLDAKVGGILVANHQSALDIPALMAALPPPVRFLAKASLFRIPLMGWYMSHLGYVPVDRRDPRRAREALRRAQMDSGGGVAILVFPEGTRTAEGTLVEFKRGSFHLARDANLPVYPVAIRNSGRLMPRGHWQVDPGSIEVIIGEPLPPDSAPSARAFAELAQQRVAALLVGPSLAD